MQSFHAPQCKNPPGLSLLIRHQWPSKKFRNGFKLATSTFWLIPSCLKCISTDRLTLSYSVTRTRSCRYGKRALLFCHNVWPSCCVTIPQVLWQCLVLAQCPNFCIRSEQARRQDLAAEGATFLKYSIGCMQQPGGQTWNGGTSISNAGPVTTGPHAGDGTG